MAVDFGSSNTCAVLALGSAPPQVVLVDGAPVMPSAVCAGAGGGLFVGQEAGRQAGVDPARYEPHPKRRIDEHELLLGDTVVPVAEVVRAVLARVIGEARRCAAGAPVDQLVLTHPADWGSVRPEVLRHAARPLAREIVLVPEPVAAALCYATEVAGTAVAGTGGGPAEVLAILDLGGGTVDASVVRVAAGSSTTGPAAVRVLATRGDPAFGGADIDQVLLEHVGSLAAAHDPAAWRALVDGPSLADRRRCRQLRADVRTAKETLSRHAFADVPLPPPLPDVHLTRSDLERLAAAPLRGAVALLAAAVAEAARCEPGGAALGGVFLIGGSSRIPLVARLVQQRTGLVPRTLELPETAVARGALHCAALPNTELPATETELPGTEFSGAAFPRAALPGAATSPPPGTAEGPPAPPAAPAHPHRPAAAAALAAVVLAAAAVAALVALAAGRDTTAESGYRVTVPPAWEQVRGDPRLRELRLFPPGERGTAVVLVQQNRLAYDSAAAPQRPGRELRDQLAATTPGRYSEFDTAAEFAGRAVVHYREHPTDGSTVDWFVLFQGQVQVSVGCRHDPATRRQVGSACREVVRTVRIQE
ncbi:MAG TPA: type VII secretion-associated protein [Pseudonocardiaceae bacterium]